MTVRETRGGAAGSGSVAGRSLLLALTTAVLAACSGDQDALDLRPAEVQAADEIEFRFAWPAGAVARVDEQVQRSGKVIAFRYTLHVDADGEGLSIRAEDVELVHVDGQLVRSAGDRAALAPLRATLQASLPPLRVGLDGAYLGVADVEAWQEQVAGVLEGLVESVPEAERKQLEAAIAVIRSPANRTMIEHSAGDRWETWVGAWRGLRAAPGAEGLRTTEVFLPWSGFGTEIELPFRFPGYVRRPADHVRLEMSGESTPEDSGNVLTRAMGSMMVGDLEGMVARISRISVLDPATMLPVRAEYHRILRREVDGERREAAEIRIWTFEWETPLAAK